jgi:hypothetical protein
MTTMRATKAKPSRARSRAELVYAALVAYARARLGPSLDQLPGTSQFCEQL